MSGYGKEVPVSNYYNNPPSNARMVNLTDSVCLALVTLVVLGRCYTKFSILKAVGREDYILFGTYIIYVLFISLRFAHHLRYGGGRHTWDIPPEYLHGFFWTKVVTNHLYIVGCTTAKFSLLLFLYRIFNVSFRFRIASWILAAVLGIWTSVTILLCIFACKPIRASWEIDVILAPTTKCAISVPNVTTIHGFCNVITDFALLLLPVPLLWKLQATTKKKLGLAAVFATGVFLIVATLPVLTPMLKKLPILSNWFSTLRSKITGSSKLSSPSSSSKQSKKPVDLDHDVERNALHGDVYPPPGSWQAPSAWNEGSGKGDEWEKYDNDGGTTARSESDITLQDLSLVGGETKDETTSGSREFAAGGKAV
ncbi:MAG: hypothetical protein Q9168_004123 [Polycauliona sp. 1 TL-2023]